MVVVMVVVVGERCWIEEAEEEDKNNKLDIYVGTECVFDPLPFAS